MSFNDLGHIQETFAQLLYLFIGQSKSLHTNMYDLVQFIIFNSSYYPYKLS
jgi:hypothetical protein